MARMPGTSPRTRGPRSASNSDRNVASAPATPRGGGSRVRAAKADGDREHGAGGDQERRPHAEHPAEHQEDDRADAHLERDRARGERSVARRHDVGDQRLERRSLHVDPGVQQTIAADQAGDAERAPTREQRHADGRRARARRARSAGGRGRGARADPMRRRPTARAGAAARCRSPSPRRWRFDGRRARRARGAARTC